MDWSSGAWARTVLVGVGLALFVLGFEVSALQQSLPGYYNDDWANGVYLHHQVHTALLDGRFALDDPSQFHPFGYNPIHTNGGNVLEMVVSGFFRLFAPWPLWLSLGAMAWIPLNVMAFVPLGRRLWSSEWAVLSAAATWALFPPLLSQLQAGRLTQVAMVGAPLAIAGLLELSEGAERKGVGLTAIGLALAGLGYWFNALFLAILSPVFLLHAPAARRKRMVVDLLASGGMALLFVSPLLSVVFWPVVSGGSLPGTHIDPGAMPLVFPDGLRLIGGQAPGLADWMPLGALMGIFLSCWRGQRTRLWLILGCVCVVFSLGPGQRIGETVVPMPYWLLWKGVPGLARMFHPDRWMLLGGVFISVMAVNGLASLRPRWAVLVPVGVMLQLWWRGTVPLSVWTPTIPDHWAELEKLEDRDAVIVFPLHGSQLAGQYQHIHGRALWGGMVEDQPWAHPKSWSDYEQLSPLMRSLRALSYGQQAQVDLREADISRLQEDGFGWVVYDAQSWARSRWFGTLNPLASLHSSLGEPVFQSESGVIWRLGQSVPN